MIEESQQKDKFWWYVAITVSALITVMILVKLAENEKFAPIIQQAEEEKSLMNVRVLN